ncbi:MFS transporter [Kocuria palustris]|uniref:MFS transporter n=1 Tax=Kocuria palustris TaxID=71999 RepID=UPI0024690680|nr:MFS transporter [Kocuria palustris]MDH5151267.1 MFS transporter [Kocuria palustris]
MSEAPATGAFRSLRVPNYRRWYAGSLLSNTGTWMQRTAQSWLVFDELTDHDARAMGLVLALQFLPQLLISPWAGLHADRADSRRVLLVTQTLMGVLALGLGALVLSGAVTLGWVMAFALALGVTTTFSAPVRQTFVASLVGDRHLSNAVALNSTAFNAARLLGPAAAGVLIAQVGTGWVFLLNSLTFAAMITAILRLDRDRLHPRERTPKGPGQIREGFRYVRQRPDLLAVLLTVFLLGTLGLNYAIFLAAMTGTVFGLGSQAFGLLNSVLAVGTLLGALLAARRPRARLRTLYAGAAIFALSSLLAALAPTPLLFGLCLIPLGMASLTMTTTANAYVQTTTEPRFRGRVMSLYTAILMGGTPIGAPLIGWVIDTAGPRWGLGAAVLAGAAGVCVGLLHRRLLRAEPSG